MRGRGDLATGADYRGLWHQAGVPKSKGPWLVLICNSPTVLGVTERDGLLLTYKGERLGGMGCYAPAPGAAGRNGQLLTSCGVLRVEMDSNPSAGRVQLGLVGCDLPVEGITQWDGIGCNSSALAGRERLLLPREKKKER